MRIAKNELTEYQKQIKNFAEEGYDPKDIAEKLGRTLSSVRSAIDYLKVKGQIDEEKMAMMREEKAKLRETKKEILDLARVYLQIRKYEEVLETLEKLDGNMLEPNEIKTIEDIKDIVKRERSVALATKILQQEKKDRNFKFYLDNYIK